MSEPQALLELAIDAARQAGAVLLEHAGRDLATSAKSTPTDLVSEADLTSERLIRELLARARPNDGYVGEEEQASAGTSGLEWVVDPLDGTINFLYSIPQWAVSIAARDAEGALVGVVFDPSRGELFHAVRGGDAVLESAAGARRLSGPSARPLDQSLVASGLAYDARVRAAQGPVLARLGAIVRDIRRFGSAALDMCWTAAGRYDAYFERTVKAWDIAAGALVCERAGLVVQELVARENLPWGVLTGPPALAAELLPHVD